MLTQTKKGDGNISCKQSLKLEQSNKNDQW